MSETYSSWKRCASQQQANLQRRLGDRIWDEFQLPSQRNMLFQKIAIALFWLPTKDSPGMGYTPEQINTVHNILNTLVTKARRLSTTAIRIGFSYIYVYRDEKSQYVAPLFRVMDTGSGQLSEVSENTYVDHKNRVYHNWSKYLETNTWGGCHLIYPKYGCYATREIETFKMTSSDEAYVKGLPASGDIFGGGLTVKNVKGVLSTASAIYKVAAIPMLGFYPLSVTGADVLKDGVVLGGVSAAIGVGVDLIKLKDMIADSEKRADAAVVLTSLIGNTVNMTLAGITIFSPALLVGPLGTGLKLALFFFSGKRIIDDINNWDNLSDLEKFQFCMAVILFANSSYKMSREYWSEDFNGATGPIILFLALLGFCK